MFEANESLDAVSSSLEPYEPFPDHLLLKLAMNWLLFQVNMR